MPIVDSVAQALRNVEAAAAAEPDSVMPPMWPANPILHLCFLVGEMRTRIAQLEQRLELLDGQQTSQDE